MMIPIQEIVNDGVQAPSGENCQPWRFVFTGQILSIFNIPEADQSLYNSKQKGSYIAHGALIENISISAKHHGYSSTVSLFPNQNNNHVADIFFELGTSEEDILYEEIYKRCTNRKVFSGEKIQADLKDELISSVSNSNDVSLTLIDDPILLKKVGHALALNEQILFENKKIHDFFYSHIIWDKKDEEKAGGFFIDTLEFLPHQLGAVKVFKNWFLLSLLNKIISISKRIAQENAQKYAQSGTFGAIGVSGKDPVQWVIAGMAVQRVWLTATKLGLAIHPCNGTLYFMEKINDGGEGEFSKKHSTLIRSAYKTIKESFSDDKHLVFIFRIGKAEAPSARSRRLLPKITK